MTQHGVTSTLDIVALRARFGLEPCAYWIPVVDLSVLIAAKDGARTVGEQLMALARQSTSRQWEVIVADNGSTDETVAVIEEYRDQLPRLTVLDASAEAGSAFARNIAASHASGTKFLFTDADDIVAPGWIDALANALDAFDAVGGVLDEGRLNDPEQRALSEPLTGPDALGRGLFHYLPRAITTNMGVRADVFRELGGFNTTFPVLVDSEFCLRLQVEGYTLGFVPDAVVHYRHRQHHREIARQIYRWSTQRPHLYREFRQHGAKRSWGIRSFAGLVVHSWWLLTGRQRRLQWYGKAIRVSGRVVGSIRYRTWYV